VIQLPFTGGIKQSIADEYLDPNTNLLSVVNGRYLHDGSVEKRHGVSIAGPTYLPGDPTMGTPERLITRQQGAELAVIDGDRIFSASPTTGVIASRGLISPCVATRTHLITNSAELCSYTYARSTTSPGFRMVACRDQTGGGGLSGNVYVTVYDTAGTILVDNVQRYAGTARAPMVVIVGSYGYLFYAIAGANTIACQVLNLSTMTWSATTNLVTDAVTNYEYVYDVTPYVGGPTGILFFYGQNTNKPRYLRLESLPALTITASGYTTPSAVAVDLVSCRHDATLGVVWFAWETNTFGGSPVLNVYAACYTPGTWAVFTAAFLVYGPLSNSVDSLGIEPANSTIACVASAFLKVEVSSATGAIVPNTAMQFGGTGNNSAILWSRPFRVNVGPETRIFAIVDFRSGSVVNGSTNLSYQMLDLRSLETAVPLRPVATLAPRQADPNAFSVGFNDSRLLPMSGIGNPSAGTYETLLAITGSEEELTPNPVIGFLDLAQLDFTGATAWGYCEAVQESYVSAGLPSFYDGAAAQEIGFIQWPQNVTVGFSAGGSLTTGTSYTWAICLAAVDNAGQIHRSTFWEVTATATTPNLTATLTIPPQLWTLRFQGVRAPFFEVYRNTAAAQTVFYFAGSVPCPAPQVGGGAYPSAVTFTDGNSDTTIGTNPLLYTTGGILDGINPPSLRCILRHVERLWGIDDTGYVVWYTTNFGPSDAPYFNESLTLQFAEGPLTALGELDGALIVFSGTMIWSVTGNGPNATGQGSDLTTATPIPTDVGAASWASMLTFPMGIMFQAPNGGMYLLDRSLTVTYQKDVQNWIGPQAGTTVVSASLVPSDTLLRFVLNTGTVVTYDYVVQRWAQETYPSAPKASVVSGGAWCIGCADGHAYQESAGYYDVTAGGSQWITLTITLANFKPGGLQGWASLDFMQWLGRILDACNVQVTLNYDYVTGGQSETRTWSYAQLAANNATMGMGRFSPGAAFMQPMAVQAVLSDATNAAALNGQGLRWLGTAWKVSSLGPVNDKLSQGVRQ
jgi:hypothetical protein